MNKKQWIYYQPTFECDQYNPTLLIHAPWAGHRCFAYDYVRNMKPDRIVELGSHYGCSSFAFLQAIKDCSGSTAFYAIDTWEGDGYTRYGGTEDVYQAYKHINDTLFAEVRSHMLRMRFDDALSHFEDGSIDLLHIDGSHAYEDLKHDYESWLPKLAPDGVVLLHDIGCDLFEGEPMGSHWYWEELRKSHPYTLEFPFSNGLGLLFFSAEKYASFCENVDLHHYQQLLNLQDTVNKDLIRRNHFTIQDLQTYNAHLQEQVSTLNYHLDRYSQDQEASSQYQQELQGRLGEQDEQYRKLLSSKEAYISLLQQQIDELNDHIAEKQTYIRQLEEQVSQLNSFASGKEAYIQELEKQVRSLNDFASDKETYIHDLEHDAQERMAFLLEKEDYIRQLEQQLKELTVFASDKESFIQGLMDQKQQLADFAAAKDGYIQELEQQKQQLIAFADSKDAYIQELEQQKQQLIDFADGKDAYIQELKLEKQQLTGFAADKDAYISILEAQNAALSETALQLQAREEECASLQSQLKNTQETSAQLLCTLQTLIRKIEKLPFGKLLLRDLPAISPNQEDL